MDNFWKRNAKRLRDEILEPIILFPLWSALLFGAFALILGVQLILFAFTFLFALYLLQQGSVLSLPPEFWSTSGELALLIIPTLVACALLTRYSWRKAKARHPNLQTPRK